MRLKTKGLDANLNRKKCIEMISDSGINYDVILRYRTEIQSSSLFEIDLNELTDKTGNAIVFIPSQDDWNGINDKIAYGNLNSMKVYTELYDHLVEYFTTDPRNIHPETVLLYHLHRKNINIKRFS